MKRLLFLIITGCLYLGNTKAMAQYFISPQIIQNGEVYGFDHVFTNPAPLTFSLIDNTIKGEWRVSILSENGEFEETVFEETDDGQCIFDPNNVSWKYAARMFITPYQRSLFEIKVTFITDKNVWTHKTVNLGLCPSTPVISDVKFIYDFDWEYDMVDIDTSDFSFNVHSDNATAYDMSFSYSFLFEVPRFFGFQMGFKGTDDTRLNYNADWGEYIFVQARNKFGDSHISDIICTTSYINDEKILNRIAELKTLAGIGNTVNDKVVSPVWSDNNILTFHSTMSQIDVYDLLGAQMVHANDITSLDLSHLTKGVYIVTYSSTTGNQGKIKILKQ